jgi:parallel beta-helix repeat protein
MITARKRHALALIIACLISFSIGFAVNHKIRYEFVSAEPFFLDVNVYSNSILVDTTIKLAVNQPITFHATANGTEPYTYTWAVTPSAELNISINNLESTIKSTQKLQADSLTLKYPVATEQYVTVYVSVQDANGYFGSLHKPIIVYDPYDNPSLYLGAYGAPYSYLIETDNKGWYRAVNGKTGDIVFQSIQADITINNALNALTEGRTWKEKVICTGNITVTNTIRIHSYTIFEIMGKITVGNNVNANMIENFNLETGDTAIELRGGEINGNGNNQNAGCIIYWSGVQGGIIEGMHLEDGYDSIIKIVRPSGVLTETNRIINNRIRVSATGYGIEAPYDSLIADNYIDYCYLGGILSFSIEGAGGLVIVGNHIWGCGDGIYLKGSNDNVIIGNYVEHNYWNGIKVEIYEMVVSGYQVITNNIIKNNSRELAGSYDAISLIGTATNTIGNTLISGNLIYDGSYHRHAIYGEYAAFMSIIGNTLESFGDRIFGVDTGSSIIEHNIGYP